MAKYPRPQGGSDEELWFILAKSNFIIIKINNKFSHIFHKIP